MATDPTLREKLDELAAQLRSLPGAVVAFSGGVDSTMLVHAAVAALGRDRVLAVTARSPSLPAAELEAARTIAAEVGVGWLVLDTAELDRDGYRRNAPNRCYFCKAELFETIAVAVRGSTEADWPVLYGAIADDLADYRPGAQAATERGVLAPLQAAGLTKQEVRAYSERHGLSTAAKPAFACMASRVPHGTPIDRELLARIERSEDALRKLGFEQFRVRHHGEIARIELEPEQLAAALAARDAIVTALSRDYRFVTLDLAGFRSGSLNPAPGNVADADSGSIL